MSAVWQVLRKDLRLGPRSPLVLWAIVLPLVLTFLVRSVFGSLFDPDPRLAIVDLGDSQIPVEAAALEGIQVTTLDDVDQLMDRVEANDFDAGLVLQDGFDEAVRAGQRPDLQLFIGGESLASDRIVIAVTALDLVRGVAGAPAPIDVVVTTIGAETLPLSDRLLPLLIIYAVAIAGAMVPAASVVEEKEKGTINALLVTPVNVHQVLAAKGIFGFTLAIGTGLMTLVINGALGPEPLAMILALALGALMMAEIGLILGSWASDTNTLFTAFKGGGILLFYPVVFYIWPSLPQWIAQLGPTYYFLQPIFELSIGDGSLSSIAPELLVGFTICLALLPAVYSMGNRLERRVGGAAGPSVPSEPVRELEAA